METLIPENDDFFPKCNTLTIRTQTAKKKQGKKEHNIKMLPHPCTSLQSRKQDNVSKSGIKRTE